VKKEAFPDMGALTTYDQTEPIYLPQGIVTYISLHHVYHTETRRNSDACKEVGLELNAEKTTYVL
jgi:hypothetical protein